jgi:enamine deaminase RidA (YjgF/YER057c/UK114 family)
VTKKKVYRAGPLRDVFALGVRIDSTIYLAGQVGIASSGDVADDIVAQTEQIYENIREVLEQFDAVMDDIVDQTIFVTSMAEAMENIDKIMEARNKAFGRNPDLVQTLVEVSGLAAPEFKIEVKCIAHV